MSGATSSRAVALAATVLLVIALPREQLDGRQLVGLGIAFAGVLAVEVAGVSRERRRVSAGGTGRSESGTVESAQ